MKAMNIRRSLGILLWAFGFTVALGGYVYLIVSAKSFVIPTSGASLVFFWAALALGISALVILGGKPIYRRRKN